MDRRDTARVFRSRLAEILEKRKLSRSRLAARVGIDRSTLSQLLSSDDDRLPRAETVAAMASTLKVSLDWLLGLSREAKLGADILHESVQIKPGVGTSADEDLDRWRTEAVGYKLRHVPVSLPYLFKTDAAIHHEYRDFVAKTSEQAMAARDRRLAYMRQPDTEMEICMATETVRGFARGQGFWEGMGLDDRVRQLDRMIGIMEETYPSLRVSLFDWRNHYSVPYTVFGPLRAAVYIGQVYLVFNTTEHIRVLTRHFDDLIRAAVVPASETVRFLEGLREEITGTRRP